MLTTNQLVLRTLWRLAAAWPALALLMVSGVWRLLDDLKFAAWVVAEWVQRPAVSFGTITAACLHVRALRMLERLAKLSGGDGKTS